MSDAPKNTTAPPMRTDAAELRLGYVYGILAYIAWAIFPLYFKSVVGHVAAIEILAQRVLWSLVFVSVVLTFRGEWSTLRIEWAKPRIRWMLLASSLAIAINWYSFIWAMTHKQIIGASLGYFMNPLLVVMLGVVVLGERLRAMQIASFLIAAVAVVIYAVGQGELPYIALVVCVSFACYGLLRKLAVVPPLVGLWIETAYLVPIALFIIARQILRHEYGLPTYALLSLSGPMTAMPLIWFASAARRLPLSTVGFLQYISPTGQFLIGLLIYGEAFDSFRFKCFIAIWIALAIFSIDSAIALKRSRRERRG